MAARTVSRNVVRYFRLDLSRVCSFSCQKVFQRTNCSQEILIPRNPYFNYSSDGKINAKANAALVISALCLCVLLYRNQPKFLERTDKRKQLNFIADVVENAADAVVSIRAISTSDFFKIQSEQVGSGFIVSSDGLIITTAHTFGSQPAVVEVRLKNGKTYRGKLVNTDLNADLALVKIDNNNLPVLKLGTSDDLRPGEWVVAIGSPLNLSNTVTAGIVSSVHRTSAELGIAQKNVKFIQTDVAITAGNSGGPLLNLDGEVVGVNTSTIVPGISFATSVEFVNEFLKTSTQYRHSKNEQKRKNLGLLILVLNQTTLQHLRSHNFKIPDFVTDGLLLLHIFENSPFLSCGLQPGDIIYGINGVKVDGPHVVQKALDENDSNTLHIIRNGTSYNVVVPPKKT